MALEDLAGDAKEPYQSLYRRFRPQTFSELRGQEHVALALQNAVRDEHVSHAYLFSGPRGTGKTSTARILAKALNCTVSTDGEPCGSCASCRSITEGSSFDVHELDAASNNGVDAMRDLVARAALATPGRWKVYIVDEVHMLSVAASNALLKTLEEPPGHVVFVLATTDPHKVLPTIRSRTQHFEFHLLAEETLSGLLEEVAQQAKLDLPPGALAAAVRRGRGSARDALSVLDQVAAAGVVDDDTNLLTKVITAIGESDSQAAIIGLDSAMRAGHDPQQLAVGLIEQLRAGFLGLASGGALPDGATTLPAEELEAVRALGLVRCVRALEVIGTALVTMRESPEPRVSLEVALIRLAHPEADTGPEALLERLERLERRLDALGNAPAPGPAPQPSGEARAAAPAARPSTSPPATTSSREGAAQVDEARPAPEAGAARTRPALGAFQAERPSAAPPASPPPVPSEVVAPAPPPEPTAAPAALRAAPTRDELVLAWGDHVIQSLRAKVRAVFQVGHFVGTEGDVALLAFPNAPHLAHAEPLVGEVAAALTSYFGVPVKVRLVVDGTVATADDAPVALAEDDDPFPPIVPRTEETIDDIDDIGEAIEGVSESEGRTLGVALATDRLLAAFPGAEEVDQP